LRVVLSIIQIFVKLLHLKKYVSFMVIYFFSATSTYYINKTRTLLARFFKLIWLLEQSEDVY
jgi:hypothetical protein